MYQSIPASIHTLFVHTEQFLQLGLAAVPLLPYMFDQPVETAVEWSFHKAFERIGGPEAVAHVPETGRSEILQEQIKSRATKEKEL